ncbi:MAG: endolytic transglycosylase MltG [Campylobacterota bacterium]|nr:endolytic transglycosylase MltG [Campylobacterota bacterium]
MALIISISFMYYLNDILDTQRVLYIPKGSINAIISNLEKREINVTKLDTYVLRLIGKPQSGWIDMQEKRLKRGDFLYKLTTSKAAMTKIRLIPGETTYIFLRQLAKKYNYNIEKLEYYYNKYTPIKEGALVPETYYLPLGLNEQQTIRLLLQLSKTQMKKWSIKIFGVFDEKKWFDYITLASIIQKEAASNEEMPQVSSVIYNRLKKGMKLQMDGTLNYGKYSHIKITPRRLREDKSSYNTYLNAGIPPYPVCNVSLSAIKAAIKPAKSDYLYFMKAKNGTHNFTRYYSTHIKNIKNATK